jgi:hypothetical protein
MKHNPLFKKYNLSHADLARMLGSKNVTSFKNSSAHKRYMQFFEQLANHIESEIIKKIKDER